jgi:hypothetical protein
MKSTKNINFFSYMYMCVDVVVHFVMGSVIMIKKVVTSTIFLHLVFFVTYKDHILDYFLFF